MYVWKWLLTAYPATGSAFITVPPEFELPLKLPEKVQPGPSSALAGKASPMTRTTAQATRIGTSSFVTHCLSVRVFVMSTLKREEIRGQTGEIPYFLKVALILGNRGFHPSDPEFHCRRNEGPSAERVLSFGVLR